MGFTTFMKGLVNKMLGRQMITQPFGVTADVSATMYNAIQKWDKLYTESITNIASMIAGEAATMATIDMKITCEDKGNGMLVQRIIDTNRDKFRSKLEMGIAYGGLIMKPNGEGGIDFVPTNRFIPISFDGNGNISEIIFVDTYNEGSDAYYTRLEYHHRNENGDYVIENKAFKSKVKHTLGYAISLSSSSKWKGIEPIVVIEGLQAPLWGYFKMPSANNIDIDSPLGVSIYSKAAETIADFDVLYSKWRKEVKNSDKVVFIDETAMMKPAANGGKAESINPLPEVVKGLRFGNNANKCIEEYNPEIRVEDFKTAMQVQLDLISVQCGFSAGYFSFDETTGAITATQVESEDRRTITTVSDIQQNFRDALEQLIIALDNYMKVYGVGVDTEFAVNYYLKDLYINTKEDMERDYKLCQDGYLPKWKYLVDWLGYDEETARKMIEEAKAENTTVTE